MFENGFIKLHRSMLSWEWYKNQDTKDVFIHLLLIANFEGAKFEGVDIPAGSVATSYPHLAEQTGISIQRVRTAIKHLKLTGELTGKAYPKFTVFTLNNWENYQELTRYLTGNQQATNSLPTAYQQATNNNIRIYKKDNKEKKEKKLDPYEIDTSDWDNLPVLSYEEAKKWEVENGRTWEGIIQW